MAAPLHVESSRTVPVAQEQTFDVVLPEPLTGLFSRRYLVFPPIREVRDQAGQWGTVGQSRTIVLSDGGTLRETLTSVERPSSFGYRIDQIRGPMKPLVSGIKGRWGFEPSGTGCRITWSWTIQPTNGATARLLPLLGRMWQGYARQALEEAERILVG
jgi:Polyketide cyclase / dehydrase and lipid transport